jgi:hypothetical protein
VLNLALSGPDNVGKTTQLRWLTRLQPSWILAGSIDAYDERWQAIAGADFATWWFETSTTEEHTRLIFDSYDARAHHSTAPALWDRGYHMLVATCAATAQIKDGIATEEALARVEAFAQERVHSSGVTLEILLLPAAEAQESLRLLLPREQVPVGTRYAAYQRALLDILTMQRAAGKYAIVLECGETPILDVHARLAAALNERGIEGPRPIASDIDVVWGLAGLSESGKSRCGRLLMRDHHVARLKIGYLVDAAAHRLHRSIIDLYSMPEETLAEEILYELHRYASAHREQRWFSIESLHRFEATRHLKRLLGARFQIVFIDAPEEVRRGRAIATDDVGARDREKTARGANDIRNIADATIDNSRTPHELRLWLRHIVARTYARHGLAASEATTTDVAVEQWLNETVSRLRAVAGLRLVALTGSAGISSWIANWSDVDLLIVGANADAIAHLMEVWGNVPMPDHVKVGPTFITEGEADTLSVTPRVLRALWLLSGGSLRVLYGAPGWTLGRPPTPLVAETSLFDIAAAATTLRRLLPAMPLDVRQTYKHTVLLAKLLLRANDRDLELPDEILDNVSQWVGAAYIEPLRLRDVAAGTVTEDALRRAAARLLVVYGEMVDAARAC